MNLVRMLREKKGWSQDQLATVCGVGKRTIQRVEVGEVQPNAETIMALAQRLGIEPDAIVNWSGLRHRLRACVAAWRDRPPTEKELATLPPRFRRLFAAHHDAIARHQEWMAVASELSSKSRRIHDKIMSIHAENSSDLDACRGAPRDLDRMIEILRAIEMRAESLEHARAEYSAVVDDMRRSGEQMIQLSQEAAEIAIRLDRELDAYDVFAAHAPAEPTV